MGGLIEDYYLDLTQRRDELEQAWKDGGGPELVIQLSRIKQALDGSEISDGKSGDPWLDDWDGEEEEPEPDEEPDDDWEDVTYADE